MSTGSTRLRLIAVLLAWIATISVLAVWYTSDRETGVVIAAGEGGGEAFTLAMAIADVAGRTYSDFRVEVYETGGSAENARLLESGFADLAIVQSDTPFEGDIQIVAALYSEVYQLIAHGESDIQSFADLTGKRVAIAPRGSGQYETFWFLADHYDISEDALTALPMSSNAADFAMSQGQVDALFRVRAVGNPSIETLVRRHSSRVVPIRQAAALAVKRPTLMPGSIPRGSYRGNPAMPTEDLPTARSERLLVARAGVSESVVHDLTRMLFEERADLVDRSVLAGLIHSPDNDGRLFLRLHPGAQRYFNREQPGFIQENSRVMAALLYVAAILMSALFALRARFQSRQKIRMGHLNIRLMEISDQIQASEHIGTLDALRTDLIAMLRQVVDDLDNDRVSHEEFEYFSFTWRAVNDLLRDRVNNVGLRGTES